MVFPILGGNSAVGGYSIDNSLRFNDNDSPYLSRTPSTTTNRKTWTWSGWYKRSNISTGIDQDIFSAGLSSGTVYYTKLIMTTNDTLAFANYNDSNAGFMQTNAKFRDCSAWYHIVLKVDTTQSTSTDRVKIYVNGIEQSLTAYVFPLTYPSQNTNTQINSNSYLHSISRNVPPDVTRFIDGYLTEVNFIDGQALSPTDFGEFDEDSGIWKPIQYTGSYGTNGFYLDFENSGSLGADQSGNGNNFTPTNLASTDQTTDTPTNNFATLNYLDTYNSPTLSEGNTKIVRSSGYGIATGTVAMKTGKWYWEIQCPTVTTSGENESFGISKVTSNIIGNNYIGLDTNSWALILDNATDIYFNHNNSFTDSGINASNGDIFMFALDADTGKLWFGRNGTWLDSGNPSAGTNQKYTANTDDVYYVAVSMNGNDATLFNFGNPAFSISSGNSDENGYGNFEYAPPTGFLALCTQNLATALSPTIDDGSQYFNPKIYTGTGSATSITGVGFQPDFTWIKQRNNANNHKLMDSSRGSTKFLVSANTDAESTDTQGITSFDSDGFSLGTSGSYNGSGGSYVSWNWTASGSGTTSSNTDGDITSTVQVNATAGFSIVQFTKTGDDQAVGHGLGKKPKLIIIKPTNTTGNWIVMPEIDGVMSNKYLLLNGTDALGTDGSYAEPTSSVFYVSNQIAGNNTHIGYVFTDIEGYSKFGSYTGNGSTDGTFVYTGFRPAMILLKRTDTTASWFLYDNKRDSYNEANASGLYPNLSNAEFSGTSNVWDFTSNGFKGRASTSDTNASGGSYIYMAFAENPFVSSSGVPVVAR